MIDNEQRVFKIEDNGQGKASIIKTVDMALHNLEDDLQTFA